MSTAPCCSRQSGSHHAHRLSCRAFTSANRVWLMLACCAIQVTQPCALATPEKLSQPLAERGDADNPPRVNAATLNEYKELAVHYPAYVEWTKANIHSLEYETDAACYTSNWTYVLDAAAQNKPEVVVVTQLSVSRLSMVPTQAREWGGPITLAIYIESNQGDEAAQRCRDNIVDWLESLRLPNPMAVSFLYSRHPSRALLCSLPETALQQDTRRLKGRMLTGVPDATHRHQAYSVCGDPGRHKIAMPSPNVSWRKTYDAFYPVNALRNLAWDQVPNGVFCFLMDIDFIPTPHLYGDLTQGTWARHMERMREKYHWHGKREALVVPAFEALPHGNPRIGRHKFASYAEKCAGTNCTLFNGVPIPRMFGALRSGLRAGVIDVFHRRSFAPGHGCYSWLTWLQNDRGQQLLDMEYRHPCEPYVIALSEALPRYDERFRGRRQDKVEQLAHMDAWGFEWRLLPEHFVVHVPHARAPQHGKGGIDMFAMPLALVRVKLREVQDEPEYKRHVRMNMAEDPLAC